MLCHIFGAFFSAASPCPVLGLRSSPVVLYPQLKCSYVIVSRKRTDVTKNATGHLFAYHGVTLWHCGKKISEIARWNKNSKSAIPKKSLKLPLFLSLFVVVRANLSLLPGTVRCSLLSQPADNIRFGKWISEDGRTTQDMDIHGVSDNFFRIVWISPVDGDGCSEKGCNLGVRTLTKKEE